MIKDKKITLGVTGGISAYKAISIANNLTKLGADVQVIMTKDALKFITPLSFEVLTHNKVIIDMFDEANDKYVGHIHFSQDVDLMIIAPATANIIGKAANGIADDMLSSTIIASNKPVVFAPAMNEYMYTNPIVQSNIEKLKGFGYKFIEPATGHLACGTEGIGKLADTKTIIDFINNILEEV